MRQQHQLDIRTYIHTYIYIYIERERGVVKRDRRKKGRLRVSTRQAETLKRQCSKRRRTRYNKGLKGTVRGDTREPQRETARPT